MLVNIREMIKNMKDILDWYLKYTPGLQHLPFEFPSDYPR